MLWNKLNYSLFYITHVFFLLSFYLCTEEMAEAPDTPEMSSPSGQDEPFLGTVDIILLVALLVGGVYWLFKRNKKEEKPATRSYAIQ